MNLHDIDIWYISKNQEKIDCRADYDLLNRCLIYSPDKNQINERKNIYFQILQNNYDNNWANNQIKMRYDLLIAYKNAIEEFRKIFDTKKVVRLDIFCASIYEFSHEEIALLERVSACKLRFGKIGEKIVEKRVGDCVLRCAVSQLVDNLEYTKQDLEAQRARLVPPMEKIESFLQNIPDLLRPKYEEKYKVYQEKLEKIDFKLGLLI